MSSRWAGTPSALQLNVGAEDTAAYQRFDQTAARLSSAGGGVISIYYHPNEFVTTEFWDAVNFAHGSNPAPDAWVKPRRRTADESERCYGVLRHFVHHMKAQTGVRFVTPQDLLGLYGNPVAKPADRKLAAAHLSQHIVFGEIQGLMLSPAEMLLTLLDVKLQMVDGPTAPGTTTYSKPTIPAAAFHRSTADAADFIRRFHRLPNEVFVGSDTLSLGDFAATLARSIDQGDAVNVVHGNIEFDRYFASDGRKPFNWIIHPEGFNGAPLLELGRLQGWTLKPAQLGIH